MTAFASLLSEVFNEHVDDPALLDRLLTLVTMAEDSHGQAVRVACDKAYTSGFGAGYEQGHEQGYNEGFDAGYDDGICGRNFHVASKQSKKQKKKNKNKKRQKFLKYDH